MPYTVYIVYSANIDQYYIGQTENLPDRLFRHRNSSSLATKKAKDWELVYKESFDNRANAVGREKEIKSKKSRKYIQELIKAVG